MSLSLLIVTFALSINECVNGQFNTGHRDYSRE